MNESLDMLTPTEQNDVRTLKYHNLLCKGQLSGADPASNLTVSLH
jgi:hypothetical protein